jgi:hypothetical protein
MSPQEEAPATAAGLLSGYGHCHDGNDSSDSQGSQAPLKDFDQLVEGPWPISTSCPPGCLWGRGSAFWRENWSKHPPFWAQTFDQLVDGPFKISDRSSRRGDAHSDLRTFSTHRLQASGVVLVGTMMIYPRTGGSR